MTLVVDASVAVRWTLDTPLSDRAEQVLRSGEPLIAPDFVIVETANVLFLEARDRSERVQRALDGVELLPRWFAELTPSVGLRSRALALAFELRHSAYDCFYLALAATRNATLVTTDEKLIRIARTTDLADLIVHLADWRPA